MSELPIISGTWPNGVPDDVAHPKPPGSAHGCPTTPRGYPYETHKEAPGVSNFEGMHDEAASDTLAARVDTDMTALMERVKQLETTVRELGQSSNGTTGPGADT